MGCPKCNGLVVTHFEVTHCINCGWHPGDLNRQVGSHDALNWVDRNPPSEKELQEVEA